MSVTDTVFNYNVSTLIDTPTNSIINGLNYTKTNLVPVPFADTYAQNKDNGMMLPQIMGNNLTSGSSYIDSSWSSGVVDTKDHNKYWIANSMFGSQSLSDTTEPLFLCSQSTLDSNGRTYCEVSNACPSLYSVGNTSDILYQDSSYLYAAVYNASSNDVANLSTTIYKLRKVSTTLIPEYSVRLSYPKIYPLKSINGKLIFFALGSASLSNLNRVYLTIRSLDFATGTVSSMYEGPLYASAYDQALSFCTNIDSDNNCYFKLISAKEWYRINFDSLYTTANITKLTYDQDNVTISQGTNASSTLACYHYCQTYSVGSNKYIASISVNKYSYTAQPITQGAGIQLYKLNGDVLNLVQYIPINAYSFCPRNDWSCLMFGTKENISVYAFDSNTSSFIQRPTVNFIPKQWGFDLDSRLWIFTNTGNLIRFNYNQPANINYSFEKLRYSITADFTLSWVEVTVSNYLGEQLNMTVTLVAEGNYTFENGLKETTVALLQDTPVRLPIYITDAGQYSLRLK